LHLRTLRKSITARFMAREQLQSGGRRTFHIASKADKF
jgi:hypothetical protein